MSDTEQETTDPTSEQETTPPSDDTTETDWKAEAEKFKGLHRKQEERAKANAAAAKELEKLKASAMSDQEKAVEDARKVARTEALGEANARILRAEVKALAGGKLADPTDAVKLLDLSQFEVDDDGEIDAKAVAKAIDALVVDKPYLAPTGTRPTPLPGGGSRPSGGHSMNDAIREAAGR